MDKAKKSFALNALRRSTYKWAGRWIAEKRSHVGRGEYLCEDCGQILSKKETQMDHVIPVIDPVLGWQGFDSVIERMLVPPEGWQRLCIYCHDLKTKAENSVRSVVKKENKAKKDS